MKSWRWPQDADDKRAVEDSVVVPTTDGNVGCPPRPFVIKCP